MKNIKEAGNLKGRRVLLRADFNVPISEDKKVLNDFRVKKALPTIEFLKEAGAKIVLASHIESKETDSLRPVFESLKENFPLQFVSDFSYSEAREIFSNMKDGDIVLLENLRQNPGEKKNDEEFARNLASVADIFVNDAFSASHRNHASIVGISKFIPGFAGLLFQEEVENLSKSFKPESPSIFILGGAKFETKIPLIKKCLEIYDVVFVGGALAHNFFKEQGFEIGNSLVSEGDFGLSEILKSPKIIFPEDVIVKNKDGEVKIKSPGNVEKGETIFDAGPKTLSSLAETAKKSKFILWNGPLGNYEEGFDENTFKLAKAIAESEAESVVGGGDTLAAISSLNIEDKFSFVSTGGGAMLDFLANETLPGIEALVRD